MVFKGVLSDTTEEALQVLRNRQRQLSPATRFSEGIRAAKLARELTRAGIRARHPEYGQDEVEQALARLLWGDELYRRARPGLPLLEP